MEIWKSIIDYPNYEVSSLGRVKSLSRRSKMPRGGFRLIPETILKPCLNKSGYYYVSLVNDLNNKKFRVHSLVARCFLNHVHDVNTTLVINHINYVRTDNSLVNLEVITQRENANKKHIKSTSKYVGVFWNKQNNKWRAQIHVNKKLVELGSFTCEIKASKAYQKALSKLLIQN